jgi:RHS repeat-associated protein
VAPLDAPDGEIDAADAWIAHAAEAGIVDAPASPPSDPRRLLYGAARRLLALDGGDVAYLHHDHLGSITLATDADGQPIGETLYYPNGAIRYRRGFTDEHGFTGQEEDASSGLIAFRHRYLDPEAGRWTSPDPSFAMLTSSALQRSTAEATSLYGYVGNRGVNAFDPDGLASINLPKLDTHKVNVQARVLWRRTRHYVVKHAKEIGLAAVNAAGQGMIAGPAAAGVAVAMTVGGMALGGGIRRLMHRSKIRIPDRAKRVLRAVGRVVLVAGAVAAVGGFAVGLLTVTGGGVLFAGSVAVGAWNMARVVSSNSYADYGGVGGDAVTLRRRGGGPRVSAESVQGTADWVQTRRRQMRAQPRLGG